MSKIEILLDNINLAFKGVSYPKYDYYHAIADMEYLDLKEVKEKENMKKNWSLITKDELIQYGDFIFFIKDSESIYYFPTYMQLILKNNELVDYGLYITFLMKLRDIELYLFNINQKKVILDFLLFLKNKDYDIYDKGLFNKVYQRFIRSIPPKM